MLWENLREEEFKDALEKSKGLCILPIGCLEKHGPHLPVGTDIFVARDITEAAAEIEDAVVFPTMYFGEKSGAGEFAGTVMFSAKLRFDILTETCKEIARNGFKKILIYNGHGGNASMIGNFTRSVLAEKNDYMVFSADNGKALDIEPILSKDYPYLTDEDKKIMKAFVDRKDKTWGHACFVESGWIYCNHKDICRLDKMNEESGENTGRFKKFGELGIATPFSWMANYPNSYDGTFHEGLNERISRATFDYSVELLVDVIKFLKTETISDEYHKEWLAKQA